MDDNETYDTVKHVFDHFELYLLSSLYIYLILVINIEIIMRFIFNSSTVWANESAQFMYIYLTWIGVSWGVHKRVHVRLDILYTYVSERTKGILYILSGIGILVFSAYAILLSLPPILTSLEFGARTPGMRVSRAYFQVAIPVAFCLTIVRTLQWLYRDAKDLYAGRPIDTGTAVFEGGR